MIQLVHFKPISAAFGAPISYVPLVGAEDIDHESRRWSEMYATVRLIAQAPEDQGRVQRNGCEGIDRHADRMILDGREYNGDPRREPSQGGAVGRS